MISPAEALEHIGSRAAALSPVKVKLHESPGCVLAENVVAPHPLPRFDNSAMDGYAVRSGDTGGAGPASPVALMLRDTIHAGSTATRSLRAGEACGIMTGAPMPRGADSVIPVEVARVEGDRLVVDDAVPAGRHVRKRGEEVEKGATLATRGAIVHPGVMACLATAGRDCVRVIPAPRVSVIATGDETVSPGRSLRPAQIYDSNSHTIAAALADMGVRAVRRRHVKDRPAALDRAVASALATSDVVILLGGVSVGEHDFVRGVLRRRRVKEVFWRVAQKPGKPLYFGGRGRKLVFGLPGNPASAFTCFYVYVYPALRRLAGLGDASLPRTDEVLAEPIASDARLTLFLKGRRDGSAGVRATRGQRSHMIAALAEADRLIVVPRTGDGDPWVLRLPYSKDRL